VFQPEDEGNVFPLNITSFLPKYTMPNHRESQSSYSYLYFILDIIIQDYVTERRIKKANSVFVQLYPVWRYLKISKEVKIQIFNTNVKSVLLYACETSKSTNQITRTLQIFVNKSLRQITNIKRTNKITNKELWRITHQKSIENSDKKKKMELHWTHIM